MTQINTLDATWSQIRLALKKLFPADLFEMWFEDLRYIDFKDNHLRLQTGSEFNAIWVENNYMDVMLQQATIIGKPIKISVLVDSAEAVQSETSSIESTIADEPKRLHAQVALKRML